MKIEVISWEKFNPRKDLKSMPWFRLNADIGYSETLYGLDADQKWLWIYILSTCARKISGEIEGNLDFMQHSTGIKKERIKKTIQLFETKGLVRITNESGRDTNENVPNITNITNRTEHVDFDFNSVYALYPNKTGKKKGMEHCARHIKTEQQFSDLLKATKKYAAYIRENDTERKYIKQFSTFMNCWEDWVDYELEIESDTPISDFVDSIWEAHESNSKNK